nr:unnamed protein product [Callosobruchus chinensis]CAH7743374.1 unnamed protein product [Callosobruchus chinensis]
MAMASYDDIDMYLEENCVLKLSLMREGPSDIVKQRRHFGEFSTLYETLRLNDKKFHEYTRMSVTTFDYILTKIESRLERTSTNFHLSDLISPAEKLIVTLRFLATGTSFRSLAFSFRMGKTTVANIVYATCEAVWQELVNLYMPQPTREDFKRIAEEYYRLWQFPMCIGSIDGKHCRIRCPANSGSAFFNYKQYFSIVLQAVADANKKFIAIEVGGKGKQSDGGTFHYSTFNKLIETGSFEIPSPDIVPGTTTSLPYVFIADEAYPLKPKIMRPFPSRNLDNKSENFNKRLSRARKCIECAFGIWTGKWRILNKAIETNKQHACLIIKTTCLLHNILRELEGSSGEDNFDINNKEYACSTTRMSRRNNSSSIAARDVRNRFSDFFWETRN